MSFILNLPPSMMAKQTKAMEVEGREDDPGDKKKTREDYKKMKELEEMRKLGNAPAMTDEEGKDINPHIPQYVMQAPWYLGMTQATLKHQRLQKESMKTFSKMDEWYKKGINKGSIATKFRKGACENCGAITHKKKDCLERPRKIGAKFTGEDFAPDEHIQPQLSFDFDGKRDLWNGVDLNRHQTKLKNDFSRIEEAKQALKAENLESTLLHKEGDSTGTDGDDDHKYAEDIDMPGQKFETKQRITVRNLRIREDTAKYLYNLDVNSAYYDPKTRSMRADPSQQGGNEYMGDNFVRVSGDAHEFAKKQLFAWEAYERGANVHLQADPTKTELLAMEVQNKKESFKTEEKEGILKKYGGEEHLQVPPRQLLLAQTEDYIEFSRIGTVIMGREKKSIQSRYEEDMYPNNHSSVWGSFWHAGQWGYRCCNSFIKESYCTGEPSKQVALERPLSIMDIPAERQSSSSELQQKNNEAKTQNTRHPSRKKKRFSKKQKTRQEISSSSSPSSFSSESESDTEDVKQEKKLKEAVQREKDRVKEVNKYLAMDERKRPYNVLYKSVAPSEEDLEVFRMKRSRSDDPMADFITK